MQKRYPVAALAAVVAMATAHAWVSDDAFITFRVVDQFLAGHGPVFNIGERVQVFTHPLWLFLLAAWSALGGSFFPGTMGLSLALFTLGLALVFAAYRDKPAALLVVAATLFFSRSLMDFATGGLETPLSFALFAAAVHALRTGRNQAALAFLALLPLNRLDLLPWVLPFAWIASPPNLKARAAAFLAVCAPAGLWIVFSTVYYGAPLPNTALAKLGGDLAGRIDQGASYLVASFLTDPGALALLLLGAAAAIRSMRKHSSMARATDPIEVSDRRIVVAGAASAAIDLAYVLWCGGDFMLGRFILPALWALIAVVLASFPPSPLEEGRGEGSGYDLRAAAFALALLGLLHLLSGQSTTNLWLKLPPPDRLRGLGYAGAIDERRFYIPWLGAFSPDRFNAIAAPPEATSTGKPKVVRQIGVAGYLARRDQPVVDAWSLVDPLLARIMPLPHSRPGHGYRPTPPEFWRWREEGHSFRDGELDKFARRLRLAHLSPDLWSVERARAIAWLASRPTIATKALEVVDDGSHVRIDLDPVALYRPTTNSGQFRVWLRVYEERLRRDDPGITPTYDYSRALDRQCAASAVPPNRNEAVAIEVRRGERLSVRCPRSVVERDGILMRVGATDGGAGIVYDEAIAIVRQAFRWWLDFLPRWIGDGWRRRPWPPLAVCLLLLGGAIALAIYARRQRL